jgi:hypothetical protein
VRGYVRQQAQLREKMKILKSETGKETISYLVGSRLESHSECRRLAGAGFMSFAKQIFVAPQRKFKRQDAPNY